VRKKNKKDPHVRTKAKPIEDLLQDDDLDSVAELHDRLAFPIAVVVFGILAIPLSYSMPRQSLYGRLFVAVLLFFTYINLIAVAGTWIEKGVTPAWLGMWWLHAGMTLLAVILLGQDSRLVRHLRRSRK